MKMNSARTSNNSAVVEEKKKEEDPNYRPKRLRDETPKKDDEEEHANAVVVPKGREYLSQTAEQAGHLDAKRRKKEKNTEVFGWDVFNQDSLLKAHDKRVNMIVHQDEEYKRQQEAMGEQFYATDATSVMAGASHQPLADALDKSKNKRGQFSRRRTHFEDEDVTAINDR